MHERALARVLFSTGEQETKTKASTVTLKEDDKMDSIHSHILKSEHQTPKNIIKHQDRQRTHSHTHTHSANCRLLNATPAFGYQFHTSVHTNYLLKTDHQSSATATATATTFQSIQQQEESSNYFIK